MRSKLRGIRPRDSRDTRGQKEVRKMGRKLRGLLMVALMVALLVGGCRPAVAPTAVPKLTAVPPTAVPQPIKLGAYAPISGAASFSGQMMTIGWDLAHTLRPTALGRPVELVICDERTDKAEATACMSRLIEQDRVVGVLGTAWTGICIAAGEVSEKAQVPVMAVGCSNPLVTKDKRYYFHIAPLDQTQGRVPAEYAVNVLKAEKAAVLYDVGNDANTLMGKTFIQNWQKLGKAPDKLVELTFRATDTDFSSLVIAMQRLEPDVVYCSGSLTCQVLAIQQAHSLGLYPQWIGDSPLDDPSFTKIGGKDVEGVIAIAPYHPQMIDSPQATAFLEAAQAKWGRPLTGFEALAFDGYNMMVTAIENAAAKGVDVDGATRGEPKALAGLREAVRDELEAFVAYPGVTGPITMPPDHNPEKALAVIQVKNGKFEFLYTAWPPGMGPK
jgi:branched-chain amino acid transport system substrate-binding protein